VGHDEDAIYIDLCNPQGDVIKITRDEHTVVRNPPIHFVRNKGMMSLPLPVDGGEIDELRTVCNIQDDDTWNLCLGSLLNACHPRGPYVITVLQGEQNTAKTTMCEFMRSLIDPRSPPHRALSRNEEDLFIMAENSWLLAFDNISYINNQKSDALCRLATGGGYSTRTLYTNTGETVFDVMRPMIFNGIGDIFSRGDLLDRAIVLSLKPLKVRRKISDLKAEFREMHPRILGALCRAIAYGLRSIHDVQVDDPPRMVDWAEWVQACEPALGLKEGTILASHRKMQKDLNEIQLDGTPLKEPILRLASVGVEENPTSLLWLLNDDVDDETRRDNRWPKNASLLGRYLNRYAPAFRGMGVNIEFTRHHEKGRRWKISLCKPPVTSVTASQTTLVNDGMSAMTDDSSKHNVETFGVDTDAEHTMVGGENNGDGQ